MQQVSKKYKVISMRFNKYIVFLAAVLVLASCGTKKKNSRTSRVDSRKRADLAYLFDSGRTGNGDDRERSDLCGGDDASRAGLNARDQRDADVGHGDATCRGYAAGGDRD